MLLVVTVRAPVRRAGKDAARGHRVFPVARDAVQGLDVALGERRFTARRAAGAWELDGRSVSPRAAAALDDLVDALVALRVVDVFRGGAADAYGLDRPAGTITLSTPRGTRRVVVGGLNAAGSALYAQRVGDPRVLLVGTLLLTEIERVFYARDGASAR